MHPRLAEFSMQELLEEIQSRYNALVLGSEKPVEVMRPRLIPGTDRPLEGKEFVGFVDGTLRKDGNPRALLSIN